MFFRSFFLRKVPPIFTAKIFTEASSGPMAEWLEFEAGRCHVTTGKTPSVSPAVNGFLFKLGKDKPGRVAQSVEHLTFKSEVLGLIPVLATYFHFSFR